MIDSLINAAWGQHQNQSSQSYSAAVARDLGLMNQYFTAQNMEYSKILQSALNSESFGYNKALAGQQFDYEKALAALQHFYQQKLASTSFAYDAELAKLSQSLNKLSADQDYSRSVKFIRDNLLAYKSALQEAGYNPLLALGSSAASYSGHTNATSLGSVSSGSAGMGSIGLGSVSSGGISGSSPSNGSGVGVPSAVVPREGVLSDTIKSAFELAKVSSEIKSNEASADRDKATAAESLERAKTEANQRTDTGHKIQSETARNYGSIASSIAAGIGTAFGATKAAKIARSIAESFRAGRTASGLSTVASEVGSSATSANVGSRILGAVLPAAAGVTAAKVGEKGMQEAKEAVKTRNDDKNWYDKWRRVFFPMTGGM